jgi:hypothetical protein
MPFRKYLNNVLKLLDEPLSVIELAKEGCLPPMLHITTIALLRRPDSEKLQKAYEIYLKGFINKKILPVITVEEYVELTIEHDSRMDISDFIDPPPPGHLPPLVGIGVLHSVTDELKEDKILNSEKRRIYVVKRNDMKRFLESENEWPLPESNLLSRWWPKNLDHNKIVEEDNISPAHEDHYFRLEKEYWRIRYQGESWIVKQSLGMQYITALMQRAYEDQPEIHVAELFYLIKGRPAAEDFGLSRLSKKELEKIGLDVIDFEEGLDLVTPEGKKWSYEKSKELIKKIDRAKDFGNVQEAEKLMKIKEDFEDYLIKAYSLSRKVRKVSDPNEKVRKSVSKAIYNALEGMGLKDGDNLALYLNDHLSMGLFCSFRKDTNISWKIIKK